MEEKELRRALLTLRQAGEIELRHVYGEINSLWEARETVRKFLREASIPTAPSVGTAAREPVAERSERDG